jgi:membrane protein implicated in regulation of membrane protease activity
MNKRSTKLRSVILRIAAVMLGLVSAFFVFYTIRLLFVTKGLSAIRSGGGGTYIGAIVFPILALLFAFSSWRCIKTARSKGQENN